VTRRGDRWSRRAQRVLVLAVIAGLVGCSGKRVARVTPTSPAEQVGIYRARFSGEEVKPRRFRLLLYAASPDRIHCEVISPVGSTLMVLDGGGGRLAVTFVRDGVSYVGTARPETLERVFGLRLGLDELVGALLGSDLAPAACRVERQAAPDGELPARFGLDDGRRRLDLELKRFQPLKGPSEALGTGEPPPGTELRPLDELTRDGSGIVWEYEGA